MSTPAPGQDASEIEHEGIRAFAEEWAAITRPDRIELVDAADEERLTARALAEGVLAPAGEGRYLARSHPRDTARSESRTVVATSSPDDRGAYNNWRPAQEVAAEQRERMAGASEGRTMYVLPYLMAVPGTPVSRFGVGVQLTDDLGVVLHMMRMARVGMAAFEELDEELGFVRAVHVTGDLDAMRQGAADDRRLFATLPEERLILHYGSAYGGNALLGKIAHALRLASYDGWRTGAFLAEQFMLLGIVDTATGERFRVCGGFPSASGKTNLAMTFAPDALGDRYRVEFYGDDIVWMWRGEDGRLRAMNPEAGIFGVARDTSEQTNPAAMAAIAPGGGAIFANVARHEGTGEVWWEGRTPEPPSPAEGWRDWAGRPIAERGEGERDEPWAHPNSRFAATLGRVPNLAPDAEDPAGVPVDAIIFGGRTRDREPLIRALRGLAEGVYDGLTLGAEATFAAEGLDGTLRYDPMSMRPFMSVPEGRYAAHWLELLGALERPPIFAHVNWFRRGDDGSFLWPGYRDNLRALAWLMELTAGRVDGAPSPIGVLPAPGELPMAGLELEEGAMRRLLEVDWSRWQAEIERRADHLAQFEGLPEPIRAAHERMARAIAEGALDSAASG